MQSTVVSQPILGLNLISYNRKGLKNPKIRQGPKYRTGLGITNTNYIITMFTVFIYLFACKKCFCITGSNVIVMATYLYNAYLFVCCILLCYFEVFISGLFSKERFRGSQRMMGVPLMKLFAIQQVLTKLTEKKLEKNQSEICTWSQKSRIKTEVFFPSIGTSHLI